MHKKHLLQSNWKFKLDEKRTNLRNDIARKLNRWHNADVPGTVHTDLIKNKIIGNPFYADNEIKLQWISDCNWIYKTQFGLPKDFDSQKKVSLIFEGIDTIAEIFLNGKSVGKTENMFLKYQFDITEFLRVRNNELIVKFYSPVRYSREQEAQFGKLPVALNSHRIYIRKAQYSFGWDWGPSFPTSGLWRSVYLLQHDIASIENIDFNTIDISDNHAVVEVSFEAKGKIQDLKANIALYRDSFSYEKSLNLSDEHTAAHQIKIEKPSLWFPNGCGEQNLYDLKIILTDAADNIVDEMNKKIGIRKIELILRENESNTFYFKVNSKRIFVKGFNWIPADSFLPRVDEKKYEKLLSFAKESGANMIRVWGGGIYEDDYFYETCDRLGLLVWQDFMFACGAYPEHEKFLSLVKDEVEQNIKRLRNHPCIAIFCGNNENEWIWFQQFGSSYKNMPGYIIYSRLIPEIIEKLSQEIPYWQSSPFGFDEDPNSHKSGNRHEWGIWSKWIDYSEVKNDQSLFITEFGFQAPANRFTFEKYLPVKNRKIHNLLFEIHNKQVEGPERIFRFLSAHLPVSSNWKNYFYLAQLNQGLALKTCIEHWRDNYPVTNGSIIWQLNDCWPVSSWSVIDSSLEPKLAYFFVKNIFSNYIITFREDNNELHLNAINNSLEDRSGKIKIEVVKTDKGSVKRLTNKKILLKRNSKVSVMKIPLNNSSFTNRIFLVSLYNLKNELLFRNFYAPLKLKYMRFAKPKIKMKISSENKNNFLLISTDKTVFFMDIIHPKLSFSDRGFILLPGEEKKLMIDGSIRKNFNINELEINYLNKFLT
jgi:beta-mannosidase